MIGNIKEAEKVLRHDTWKIEVVKSGACRQAIRPDVTIKSGDLLLHFEKKQTLPFRADVCTATRHVIFLDKSDWVLDGEHISLNTRHALARAEGFNNAFELAAFIKRTYKFPFVGTVIQW